MRIPGATEAEPIYFCFANSKGFSGQMAATHLVIHGLTQRGRVCRLLPQPVLSRGGGTMRALPRYLLSLLVAWLRALRLFTSTRSWLCISMGQTRASFIRDAVPLLMGWARLGRARIIVSLNGSLFMSWPRDSADARVFRFLLKRAGTVTVVGNHQRARLLALGLANDRIAVVVNTCDVEPAKGEEVLAKHAVEHDSPQPVRLLHLSSLIDTKGFPEYLEALCRISVLSGPAIDATLCGPLTASPFSSRFADPAFAEAWINQQIAFINSSPRARARWIKGAVGPEKASVFRAADIFVLPTRYAVEAQPLVLLEAMASGCAIITTAAGEITTILDGDCAVLIAEPSAETLAPALQALIGDASARARRAVAAHSRFVARYRIDQHLDQWERLLEAPASRLETVL